MNMKKKMDGWMERRKNIFCMDPPPLLDGCLGRELIITYRYTNSLVNNMEA